MHNYNPPPHSAEGEGDCDPFFIIPGVSYCERHQTLLIVRDLCEGVKGPVSWAERSEEISDRCFKFMDYTYGSEHDYTINLMWTIDYSDE